MVRINNIGSIFIAGNVTATNHIKHVDMRQMYVYKYVEDCIVKIVFVKSVENDSDILHKN